MPSDYHPVLLVLGMHDDLDKLADIMRHFAKNGAPMSLNEAGVFSTDTKVEMVSEGAKMGLWPQEKGSTNLTWVLEKDHARIFADDVEELASSGAPAGSVTLEHEVLGEIKIKVSIGEWEDHFLTDETR